MPDLPSRICPGCGRKQMANTGLCGACVDEQIRAVSLIRNSKGQSNAPAAHHERRAADTRHNTWFGGQNG